jgi:capsular polysaccharide transport system ATP-binding protein
MIELKDVYKFYRIERHRKVVLDHVSMKFEAGTNYAVLGVNGAGKSTLIRLIAGAEIANKGRIRRDVRVSWPLGFNGGLHPHMTGRENAQFIARIYGENVRRVVNFVEDFAEIGHYIDAPTHTYSSGMTARVAFGLSMAIRFDCYLIDEVMAVGDARFQARCEEVFRNRRATANIIMVSHSMASLQDYCERAIVLENGHLHAFSEVTDAIELYKQLNM